MAFGIIGMGAQSLYKKWKCSRLVVLAAIMVVMMMHLLQLVKTSLKKSSSHKLC